MIPEIDTFEGLLDDEEIRETITLPRNIPRRNREEIAEILYREIVLGEDYEVMDPARFINKFGVFYLLLVSLKGSDEWARLKSMARNSRISSLIMLRIILAKVFDMLDEFPQLEPAILQGLPDNMLFSFESFKEILEKTLELWQRKVSGSIPPARKIARPDRDEEESFSGRVISFHEDERSRQFMSLLTDNALLADILSQVNMVEDHLPSLEMLSLLYPGRNWDHSMLELHRTYFANLNKYSRIIERNEDIKKILDVIGRIEMEYGAKRQSMASYSRSEMYSVTTSGRPSAHAARGKRQAAGRDLEKSLFCELDGRQAAYLSANGQELGGRPYEEKRPDGGHGRYVGLDARRPGDRGKVHHPGHGTAHAQRKQGREGFSLLVRRPGR